MFSCICITYAAPLTLLEESIASFLNQDYAGPKELIVLNSCVEQKLIGDFPNVRIFNLDKRPGSLGECRNLAIERANGTHILTHDSDDIFLPNFISNFAKHFADNDWIWFERQFYSLGQEIKSITHGTCNVVGYTKAAWKEIGGFPNIGCGEDRQFISKLASERKGAKIPLADEDLSFIYRWDTGSFHASGLSDDQPGQPTTNERAEKDFRDRLIRKQVKTGDIHLNPHWTRDYTGMAKAFIAKHAKIKHEPKSVCIVQLGRFGDIINILPVAKHINDTYGKPYVLCSREFSSVLEGCSYVEPYPVDLNNGQVKEAMAIARKQFRHVLQAQIWGNDWIQDKQCVSFNMEQWRMLGFLHKFREHTMIPVFDQQDRPRALAALGKARTKLGEPLLLVNVTQSHSSPFGAGPALLAKIREAFEPAFEVLDVSGLALHRIYDLLPFMEAARAIVTIDTALIHLAAATTTPVVCITNQQPWLGSVPRTAWGMTLPYDQAASEPERVINMTRIAVSCAKKEAVPMIHQSAPQRAIYHLVERHQEPVNSDLARKKRARVSWTTLYAKKELIPCHFAQYPRNALEIGDVRPLPFLKDALTFAMEQAEDHDIIMLTNDDIFLHPTLPDLLHLHVSIHEACCAQRCEFIDRAVLPETATVEQFEKHSVKHIGRDMFAFTKAWLKRKWDQIPDFILGASEYDLCLAAMIRLDKGIVSTRRNLEEVIPPAEIPRGYIAHQHHKPYWAQPGYIDRAPSQLWNRKLMRDWAEKNLPQMPFGPDGTPAFEASPNPASTAKGIITVRRSQSLGDTVAALCVADALIAQGYKVVFQAHASCHPILKRHGGLLSVMEPTHVADVDLDGAYETDPHRTKKHFATMFLERANKHLAKRKIVLPIGANFAPRIHSFDSVRTEALPHLDRWPRPWIMICPRSQSFINRTVPINIWREAADRMPGTKFWLGNDPAPANMIDLNCRHVDLLIEYLGLADILVSVDTGPLHIAVAMGTPAVAIHQSSSPELHLSDQRDWMMVEPKLDCLNCQRAVCPIHAKYPPCQGIPPGLISDAVNARLRAQQTEDVSAIIAVYRPDPDRLNRCLEQVLPQVQEIIVVSDLDTTLSAAVKVHPKIRFIQKQERNIGYGRKANFGARNSNGKYLLMLNDDVFLEPNVVEVLKGELKDRVGMVTHLLRYPNGTIQYAGKYRPPGAIGFGHIDHKAIDTRYTGPVEQESACGASMLIRRNAFYQAGAFDEDFFLYGEDDAMALSLRQAGWRIMFTPHAQGIHEEHATTKNTPNLNAVYAQAHKIFHQKWAWYFSKNPDPNKLGVFD